MGELICLEEYKERLLLKEVEELKQQLQRIIEENNLYVEYSPYYHYNNTESSDSFIDVPMFTSFDFYY